VLEQQMGRAGRGERVAVQLGRDDAREAPAAGAVVVLEIEQPQPALVVEQRRVEAVARDPARRRMKRSAAGRRGPGTLPRPATWRRGRTTRDPAPPVMVVRFHELLEELSDLRTHHVAEGDDEVRGSRHPSPLVRRGGGGQC